MINKSIEVNADKCIYCGRCLADCLSDCLEFNADKIPQYRSGGRQRCFACQHCMAVCPAGALSFGGIDPETLPKAAFADGEQMLLSIKSRRSVRSYKQTDVPSETLDKIKEMLSYPPTACNYDSLHFSIIGTKAKMDEIRRTTYKCLDAIDAASPLYKFKCILETSLPGRQDPIYAGAPTMIACAFSKFNTAPGCESVDPIIALSYFELYAQSLGLGTLWDGFATIAARSFPEVYALLEIPEQYSLSFVLPFGLPAVSYARTPHRNRHSIKIVR
ncbi:nitroreductase family protein [bacterium]|nr:nitroreductase family protein [bacterium]